MSRTVAEMNQSITDLWTYMTQNDVQGISGALRVRKHGYWEALVVFNKEQVGA